MKIRHERPGDEAAIAAVHAACFPTDGEAQLVDRLRDAGRLIVSIVAEADGQIVGHVAFSPVTTAAGDGGSPTGVGLGPIAVVEAYRRQGIGGELVRTGLEACVERGFGWCVVLGEPAYYGRFGFTPARRFGLCDEYGGGDAFQAVELIADALPHDAGLVRYAPEFAGLG